MKVQVDKNTHTIFFLKITLEFGFIKNDKLLVVIDIDEKSRSRDISVDHD